MKSSEECMRSCLSVCRVCGDVDRPAWLVPLIVVLAAGIGFILGRFDISCSVRVLKQRLRSKEQAKQTLGQLLGYLAGQVKVQGWKHTRDKATVSTDERAERTSADSPRSDSSSSSGSGSQRKGKTSPLLVRSTRSTPTSSVCGLSSVETSPVGPGRARRNRGKDGDFSAEEHGPEAPLMQAISIPQLISRSKSSPAPSKHTLPAAAWMCGKDALTLNANMDWLDLVESGLEFIYGEEWSRNVHPDDLNRSKEMIVLAQSLKEPFQMEYRLKVGSDEFRWVLDIGKPRFRSYDDWIGFVGWRVDIHERKTIENNYYRYWELPHEFLVNWSRDGRYFDDFSPALPVFLGYTAEELKAVAWLDLVHEDDKATTNEAMEELCQGKAVASLTNRCRCKSGKVDGPAFVDSTGTYKWLNWTASDSFAACRDITSDVLAQEELRKSQRELQRITDAIPGGIFSYRVTPEGEESFPYVSKGALSLLGFEKKGSSSPSTFSSYSLWTPSALKNEEQAGRRIFGSNVHPDDWLTLEEKMKLALEKRSHLDHDYRVVIGDETKWVRVHAVPRSQPSGSVEWSGIAWDITEQHQVVDALKEARDSAEKAAQAKGKFLAHMSHEIRTPMNAVIGMSALLLETDLTEEQREYASTIRTSGEVLLGIINDILDYSKVEAGKLELELQPLNILQCVEESFDQVVPQATAKGLELTYAVSESIPATVLGDSGRVRQILVNLLSNAVKFTDHGCISVNVEGHELEESPKSDKVPYRGKERTSWDIEFSVRDSGIGIPEDRKSSLFQAFTQVDASTTRRYGGTGLGLAISARLCALHGGCIWVDGNEDEGCTFRFTIVAEEVPMGRRAFAFDKEQGSLAMDGKRILIVAGSSSTTQTMLARFLKGWHMRPVCASTSHEALRLLHQMVDSAGIPAGRSPSTDAKSPAAFDAVIFDCSLLDAEDPEVLECLALCHTRLQAVPTMLLTPFGRRTQEYYYCNQPVHFDCFVSKPVKESQLLNALSNLLLQVQDEEQQQEYTRTPPGHMQPRQRNSLSQDQSCGTQPKLSDMGTMYPLRILVAEDNLINQKVIMKLLLRLGYTADVVGNGREALEHVTKKAYDVILMDCFMPEMDGLEATRRIRETVKPTPLIVAVTAAALEEEMKACLQAGMHMYMSKPIQADELMQTLSKCWQTKH